MLDRQKKKEEEKKKKKKKRIRKNLSHRCKVSKSSGDHDLGPTAGLGFCVARALV